MKKEVLFPYNLQFFAEEEGADENATEPVEQSEGTDTAEAETQESEGEEVEVAAEPQFQSEKANAAFASMRREVEAAKKAQSEIDALYARQFGNYKNPETGQPIRSARDYADAIAAQERMQARQTLKENNIDPGLIDSLIANSPVIRQAEAATAELNNIRSQQLIDEDVKEVMRIDPTLTNREDFFKDPGVIESVNYIASHPGMRLSDAYKIVNFDRLSSSKAAAAKQAVINQVKGQSHLANGNGLNVQDSSEDIPASMLESFKDMFPDKSMKELKALYNKTLQSRR